MGGGKSSQGNIILRKLKELWYWFFYALKSYIAFREIYETKNKLKELPNRSGEIAVITGGAQGFGLEVVKQLLICRFQVFVGDVKSGDEAKKHLKAAGLSTDNVKFLHLNLKSFKSIRKFAEAVSEKASRIDLLFNNAGIMYSPFEMTEDGFESQFQVNYLGHVLLTNLLLPRIVDTSRNKELCCRIVNTASIAAYFSTLDTNTIGEPDPVFATNKAYNDSKLAQVLFAQYLDRKLSEEGIRVRVFSIHPGVVPTNLWVNVAGPLLLMLGIFRYFYKTTEDGANVIIHAALAPELENKGGLFLHNCVPENPNSQTEDFKVQKILWEKSLQFTNSHF